MDRTKIETDGQKAATIKKTTEQILSMTALELGAAIKAGKLTAVEAVKAVMEQADKTDGSLHAYLTFPGREDYGASGSAAGEPDKDAEEKILLAAAEIQRRIEAGDPALAASPLAGVPIAIKDNICTKGVKTCCASKILGDFKPFYDASVMEKLQTAGMIPLGKTNMDEFAMGSTTETSAYGPTRNPWNTAHVPGGSSGGSAAAVAAREAVVALGSDTGGSIRQPASYCGVTGFKPTYGTVSRYGLIAYASSLDQIGPIARDVADCAAMMDILSGKDEKDGTSLPDSMQPKDYLAGLDGNICGTRIAVPDCIEEGVEDDVRQATLDMAGILESAGAKISRVSMSFLQYVIPTYYIIAAAEASSNLSRFDGVKYGFRAEGYEDLMEMYCKTRAEGFGSEVKKRILLGTFVLSSGYYDAYYKKALQVKALIKKAFDEIFRTCDAILLPAAPTTAPKLGDSFKDPLQMYLSDIFTVSVNIAGLPGLSVPAGFDKAGMPIGVQIIGPALGDQKVLNIGYAFQQMTDFHRKRPGGAQGDIARDMSGTSCGTPCGTQEVR